MKTNNTLSKLHTNANPYPYHKQECCIIKTPVTMPPPLSALRTGENGRSYPSVFMSVKGQVLLHVGCSAGDVFNNIPRLTSQKHTQCINRFP